MSKIDPIYVYNRHRSPVSALCFGRYSQQPVLVSGSNDGELHVWNLTDFATLIKIQAHESKVLGLQCLDRRADGSEKMNERSPDNVKPPEFSSGPSAGESSKSRFVNENCGLRLVSQEKNGLIKFVCLFRAANEATIQSRVYRELSCSGCTFCPFQALAIGNRLLLACVSTGSSNCVNLVVMNEPADGEHANDKPNDGKQASDESNRGKEQADRQADRQPDRNERNDRAEPTTDEPNANNSADNCGVLLNKRIVQIDQNLGMISSMRMQTYAGLILLLIGTETGSCLIYTGHWNEHSTDWNEERKTSGGGKIENQFSFTLKYRQQCFQETFVSSVELDDSKLFSGRHLRLICGSVEDCLAVLDLIVDLDAGHQPISSKGASEDSQARKDSQAQTVPQTRTDSQVPNEAASKEDQPDSEPQNKLKINKPQTSFRNKETAKPVKYLKITNKGINSIACRPDGKLLASGGSDGRVRLFSLKSLNALAVLAFHKKTIEMIKFSAYLTDYKGHLLAVAGQDKLVTVWSVYNG